MNIAMILEMAADALGDRVAFGSRDDGLTFERAPPGRARRRRPGRRTRARDAVALMEPLRRRRARGPLRRRVGGRQLRAAQLPPARRVQLEQLLDRIQPVVVAAPNWVDAEEDSGRAFPDAPETPAVLLFTSGTSAAPKAAVLDHEQLLSYVFNTMEFGQRRRGRSRHRVGAAVPHRRRRRRAQLHVRSVGASCRCRRFTAEDWIDTVRDEQVTHATVVPTMLAPHRRGDGGRRVAARAQPAQPRRTAVPACTAPVLERALHLMPETDFVNAYGLTETSSTVALLGPDDHRLALYSDEPLFKNRLASVGQPMPGIEIRIVDDAGDTMGPDEPGEILIRGDQVSGEYVDTDSKVDADGWLHTGDRGWVDVEGYLFCEGRADDTIIRGGENIGPAEVEDALLQHDAIAVAAVVGLPDEEWGERIAAMVTLRPGVDEIDIDHVRDWVRDAARLAQDPRDHRASRRASPDRHRQDPAPPGARRPRAR